MWRETLEESVGGKLWRGRLFYPGFDLKATSLPFASPTAVE